MYAIRSYYEIAATAEDPRAKIFFLNVNDQEDIALLEATFPEGILKQYDSAVDNKDRITSYNVCYTKLLRDRGHMKGDEDSLGSSAAHDSSQQTAEAGKTEDPRQTARCATYYRRIECA